MRFDPQKTAQSKLILVTGNDAEARRDAVEALLKAAGLQSDDMDMERIVADTKPPVEWVGAACSIPFFSDRRAIIVRNVNRVNPSKLWPEAKIDKNHPLIKSLLELPPSALLILVADDETKSDDGNRAPAPPPWDKVVKAAGGETVKLDLPTQNLPQVARDHAKSLGKGLSPAAANLLLEMTANRIGEAKAELEKLALYVGDAKDIRIDDIQAVVSPDSEYNVFKLVDAVVAGQTVPALNQLRTLIGQQPKVETAVFAGIIPMILRQFRILWQARVCVEARCGAKNAPPAVSEAFLSNPNLGTLSDWQADRALRSARNLTFDQLSACLQVLARMDGSLKGVHYSADARETIELAIANMCQICLPLPR